jgi:predicted RNase H-like HicB family nuclease/DNA-binding XRE family transcriptional regulator
MRYHFRVTKERGGYVASCVELRGCLTQGKTRMALLKNMSEALNVFLDEPSDSETDYPLPRAHVKGKNIVRVVVDPKIAFAFYLRRLRRKHNLTQGQVAAALGLKNIFSYQRLEASRTANPRLITLSVLKKFFPDFNLDELLAA